MKRVLIVDDSNIQRKLLKGFLEKEAYEIRCVETPSDFINEFKSFSPHLCIIDINISTLKDGLKLIQALRSKVEFKVPIIAISANVTDEDVDEALELGANDYICKPIDRTILLSKVTQLAPTISDDYYLPIFRIPTNLDTTCELEFKLKLYSVSEHGLTFRGTNYIYKGTIITFGLETCEMLGLSRKSMRLKVTGTKVDSNSHTVEVFVEFPEDDDELSTEIRKYISEIESYSN